MPHSSGLCTLNGLATVSNPVRLTTPSTAFQYDIELYVGGNGPRYAQLYVYEPREALETRIKSNKDLDAELLKDLQKMVLAEHHFAKMYKSAVEVLKKHDPQADVEVRLRFTPAQDKRRYNRPTTDEVAVILPNTGATEPRDIVLRRRDGFIQRISDLHPAYLSLQYPLLFPRGEFGWDPDLKIAETDAQKTQRKEKHEARRQEKVDLGFEDVGELQDGRRITLTQWAAYRMHFRANDFNTLLRGGRLFTRVAVDMFASADQQRLRWIANNQAQFRAARLNNLEDAVATDPEGTSLNDIGQRVFLPSSYIGGPRNMNQCYQDSMALARRYRKVDLFITMTTNPQWAEIQRELLPGQTAYDRPDLVARVFELKRAALIDDVYQNGVFGFTVAYVYTIEFQKRGLPHVHCLIFLHDPDKLRTAEAIDSCIWARWPDQDKYPKLFETVRKCMVHGPCGAAKPHLSCMENGGCSKDYPKKFSEFTTMDSSGYPQYFRPDDGVSVEVNGVFVDNRWIIPYCPYLSAKYDCHINVECAYSFGTLKYIFKYVQKGPDRGSIEIDRKDEVKRYVDGRYISAPDAIWRIFHFHTHHQVPNVYRLQVHLPNHQFILFDPEQDAQEVLRLSANQRTTLTAFFDANADSGELGTLARRYTYQEFPRHFIYDSSLRRWKIRQRGSALGRMYFLKPTAGEVFYLRTLLTVVKGPTSFEDLRCVPGYGDDPLPTFYAACLARGLLHDDGEWRLCLLEASAMHTGRSLRHLFITLLLFGEPSQPDLLWLEFRQHICDDLAHRLEKVGCHNPTPELVYDYGLFLIDGLLRDVGHSLAEFPSMPMVEHDWKGLASNPLIAEQLDYDTSEEAASLDARLPRLNRGQRSAYSDITASVAAASGDIHFLHGSGGTGKTYVYNTVCAKLRSASKIVLCVSSSGISSLLLQGGRTAHSTFKIPVESLNEKSVCSISKNSHRAELLRKTDLLIWDEAPAQHRHAVEAVDRTLRDIRGCDRPFGGLTTVIGGDFLQTLPVVQGGTKEDILDATLQRSHLWNDFKILHLRENMRLKSSDPATRSFARWLLKVGHGANSDEDGKIQLLEDMRVEDLDELIASIYPNVDSCPPPPIEYFLERMILAPRNTDVDDINNRILDDMTGEVHQYLSHDQIIHEAGVDPDDPEDLPEEVLRTLHAPSLPPGELNLKVGCPIILLRNLAPAQGLCNGTRMIVTRMQTRVLEVRILGGEHHGKLALIPRISLISSKSPEFAFQFKRFQFPVRLAFALSINKAQGQSAEHVGLDLRVPVFGHGQLYVALSRVTARKNIKVLLSPDTIDDITTNVVYEEILLSKS